MTSDIDVTQIAPVQDLLDKVKAYNSTADLNKLKKACEYAVKYHGSQLRESGDPYYSHPIEVASIVAEMKLDLASIITAILHDTIEDTELTYERLKIEFGEEIAKLVDGVTKLTKIEYQPDYIRQAENFRKLLLAMSEDIRVLLVKLADRIHNMRTLKYVKSSDKRQRIAKETMEIYASLAERMGMQKVKLELQDLAFAELHADARQSIVSRLEYLRKEGAIVVDQIVEELRKLLQEQNIEAQIYGREKAPCSIWYKMQRKNVSFEQLSDIVAFRIIVKNITDCYKALGIIHSKFQIVPGEFMDFISIPKDNGYKSLHTVVIGPSQHRIEVQIRSEEMHEVAEFGVAAHWIYKQGDEYKAEGKQFRWVRELLNILENSQESQDILENTKLQMYYDQVFCFTPNGQLIVLPKGSTPVDFAYAVHSDIGNTCIGAKVNGRIVPLQIQLVNGDQIEIITSKSQTPSPTWEKFVVTAKAKSEIRKFIRNQQRDEYLHLGRAIIAKEIRALGKVFNEKDFEPLTNVFKKKTVEDLFASVGEGVVNKSDILKALFPESNAQKLKKKLSIFNFSSKKTAKKNSTENTVFIKGLIPGMALHYAGCCHPIPGDRIVGIAHTGRGITIHTADCENLSNYSSYPEMWIEVSWEKDQGDENYIGRLKVIITHEPGSLANIINAIAKESANITNLKIVSRSNDFFEILIDVEVKGSKHLSNIITALKAKSCVYSVDRCKM
ncbi:MAG: bifunctional (p)ppGpp synthetase/guanosine-3',5'-bis(diphosphate) 3'-pyrophosphohydrolase [Sphingobacteriia bacterium]|nr:bifunctional (p)ppGpp synthetase/guanosine-3',5'-bis(diphosphate) 3'-pyrophosphohydrolase [Sphingobacteriia bacterium]